MKTNGVPAIIMLAAGFIDCVIAILTHMSLWNFTRQLLLVLVLFYVIGCVVKMNRPKMHRSSRRSSRRFRRNNKQSN